MTNEKTLVAVQRGMRSQAVREPGERGALVGQVATHWTGVGWYLLRRGGACAPVDQPARPSRKGIGARWHRRVSAAGGLIVGCFVWPNRGGTVAMPLAWLNAPVLGLKLCMPSAACAADGPVYLDSS